MSACGGPSLTAPPSKEIKVDTPEMVALRAAAGLDPCPGPTATKGALPAVTLACLGGGNPVDLSTLAGPLIINVWWSGCQPCRTEMPILGDFYRAHGSEVPVLGIDLEDTYPGVALKQAAKRKATYPQLFDFDGAIQHTKIRVPGFPTFVFLTADGTVTLEHGEITSMSDLLDMVNRHLGTDLA